MHIILLSPEPWNLDKGLFAPFSQAPISMVRSADNLGDTSAFQDADALFLGGYTPAEMSDIIVHLHNHVPHLPIIPVLSAPKNEYLLAMMREGAFDILIDQNQAAISQILQRVEDAGRKNRRTDHQGHQCIGFTSAKGGDGASFVLANFSSALAELSDKNIALVDLALPFGDLEVYLLAQKPVHHLDDFLNEIERMDDALVHSMAHPLSDNFELIAAPPTFERIVNITPDNIIALIDRLKASHDLILVDMGSLVAPTSLAIMDKMDSLVMVATPSIASLRHASQMLHLLQNLDYPVDRLSIILNKSSARSAITRNEFENVLGKSVDATLPDAGATADSAIARARALYHLAPRNIFAQAISKWASAFLGIESKGNSIWHRLKIK